MAHMLAQAGPVHDIARRVLDAHPDYARFRAAAMPRAEYAALIEHIAGALTSAGLPAPDVHFAKRYPQSESSFVRDSLAMLADRGLLPHTDYDLTAYDRAATRARHLYGHGEFSTYIYPEEARLLFAVADILRPSLTAVLGSYYGYWAYWAAAAVAPHGGRLVLVDPDARAQAVAVRSFERLGLAGAAEVAVMTGEDYLAHSRQLFDCVILDAEGPRDHPDPNQRGKAVYGSLLSAVTRAVRPGAHLICHNILFSDIVPCSFFEHVIERNYRELASFLTLAGSVCDSFVECTSTEGVGVGRFRRS